MESIIISYGLSMAFLLFLFNYEKPRREDLVEKRQKQTRQLFRENIQQGKIKEIIASKVKHAKRAKVEYDIKQAGYNFSYEEYILINLASGLLFAFLFGAVMKNIYLAILSVFIGYFLPGQYFSYLKNKRLLALEKQIGSFMHMTIKRYVNTKNMHTALKMTAKELKGIEPIGSELERTVVSIDLGTSIPDALEDLAKRADNKFLERFASYYAIAANVGTRELREELLTDAFNQFEENRQLKRVLKAKISGPVKQAQILIGTVPVFALYSAFTNPDYIHFMTTTTMGKVGTTGIVAVLLLVLWFVNKKLGAPLD